MPARSDTQEPVVLLQGEQRVARGPAARRVAMSSSGGDWDSPAPFTPSNAITERYCVTPRPRMLIATPETMWSTPKVTVAIACSSPPTAPNRVADEHAGPGAPLVAGPAGAPGADDHHALEADVHHAGALGPEPAEPGHADRHRQGERGAGCPAGGEVVRAGDHPDDAQQEDQAGDRDQRQRHSGRRQPTAQRPRGPSPGGTGATVLVLMPAPPPGSRDARRRAVCSPVAARPPPRSGGPARRRRRRTARSCPA